ncbi:hypothetical protein GCM10028895_06120 [Pontibacter rugosus]
MSGASVINIKRQKATISDEKGMFLIQAADQDSILIRALGYAPKIINADLSVTTSQKLKVILEVDAVLLKEVEVIALPSLRDLKNRPYANPSNVKNPAYIPLPEPEPTLPTPSVSGPIGALYNMFSNEGKQIRQLQKHNAHQRQLEQQEEEAQYNKFFKDSVEVQ